MGTPFPDIDYNAYYANDVIHLFEQGIVAGYANGKFGPNDYVTRAQLAVVINRLQDKAVPGNYGKKGDNSLNEKTTFLDLIRLVCAGFSSTDFSKTTGAYIGEADTYNAICINSLQ